MKWVGTRKVNKKHYSEKKIKQQLYHVVNNMLHLEKKKWPEKKKLSNAKHQQNKSISMTYKFV